jgi:hypothetical protein
MPETAIKHSRELRQESPARDLAVIFTNRTCGKELTNHLGIKLSMSTAFHPQADDQQDDWAELIPLAEHAEYAYNTAVSETTKSSRFFANYGYQPETQWIRPAALEANFTNPTSELLLAHRKASDIEDA